MLTRLYTLWWREFRNVRAYGCCGRREALFRGSDDCDAVWLCSQRVWHGHGGNLSPRYGASFRKLAELRRRFILLPRDIFLVKMIIRSMLGKNTRQSLKSPALAFFPTFFPIVPSTTALRICNIFIIFTSSAYNNITTIISTPPILSYATKPPRWLKQAKK